MVQILVFWIGIIGIAGKGAAWMENYDPNRTIGELTSAMKRSVLGEKNKTIKIFKHYSGSLNYNVSDPHWDDATKLSDYVNYYGGLRGNYVEMIYVIV